MNIMPWADVADRLGVCVPTARRLAQTTPGIRLARRPGGKYSKGIIAADLPLLLRVDRVGYTKR